MARDQIDMTPIERRDELVAWLEAGCKPRSEFKVGTEHEKFAFTVEGHRPVPYANMLEDRWLEMTAGCQPPEGIADSSGG